MHKRWFSLIAVFAMVGLVLPLSGTTRAQGGPLDRSKLRSERPRLDGETGRLAGLRGGPLSQRSGVTKVMIELEDAPTTQVFGAAQQRGSQAQATTSAQLQLAQIEQAQQRVLSSLRPLNADVLFRTQRVYNGIAVKVDAQRLREIARLPGVKGIRELPTHEPDNSTSVPFIGAPELWADAGLGLTGEGLTIAVIDTGIDYLHTGFGGSGLAADYARNDTTVITDGVGFPSAKIVSGRDFVGDDYNANDPDNDTPIPDPDPMDCNGHGSHVAGTAAGTGVNADGTTYTGPYDSSAPFDTMRIGPGVAPEARLMALRVFGCEGSTNVVVEAIEYAVDPNGDGDFSDGADVINMSLGSDFGNGENLDAQATDNAVLAGVLVVASAGNSGDTYYVTGSPATASRAISVASSVDDGIVFSAIRVNSPGEIAGLYEAAPSAFGPELTETGITGDVVYAQPANACAPLTNPTAIAGKIALVDRGACQFSDKVYNAQLAGATAVIIVNNIPGSPFSPGPGTKASLVTIPSVMISQADGATIKAALAAGDTVNVTLSSSTVILRPELADTLSSFSSRGPRQDNAALKPDIAAPGQTITSVDALSGADSLTISGTSMASPHVAGAMALVRQLHPSWTVEELKALVMNTANHDIRSDTAPESAIYGPARVGAGRIDLVQAAASDVIAYNADGEGLVSLSFGVVDAVTTTTLVKNVTVVNKGSAAVTYDLTYEGVTDVPGVEVSLPDGPSVTIPGNGSANVQVQVTADPTLMKHTRDTTVSDVQVLPRHWLSEESGYLRMTVANPTRVRCDASGTLCPDLRLPLHVAPRPASDMEAEPAVLNLANSTTEVGLVGQGVETGEEYPLDELSLVTALELQAIDPQDPYPASPPPVSPTTTLAQRPDQEAPPVDLSDSADLKYVGIASDFEASGTLTDTLIYFGVATYGPWATPNSIQFQISIDTDRDGADDFLLYNTNYGSATGGDATDAFITVLCDIRTENGDCFIEDFLNGLSPEVLDTVPFNNSVMVLPVYAADLGLEAGSSTFDYDIVSLNFDVEGFIVDFLGDLTYDAGNPGLDLTGGLAGIPPTYADLPGETIPVGIDRAAFDAAESLGLLLLHHHNRIGEQSEILQTSVKVFLPTIRN